MAKKYLKLGGILKKLMFEQNIRPADLARKLDLPPPTIHRIVTGKSSRPYTSSLEPIAKYFGISVDQLVGNEPMLIDWEPEASPKALQEMVIKTVPMIAWGSLINLKEACKNAKKQIPVIGNVSDEAFAVFMNDHSMEPIFSKGSILIFDAKRQPIDRSFVLVNIHEKDIPIFRQLLVDVDQRYLKPLNPDSLVYKMRLLDAKDKILGTLFESRNNFSQDDESILLEISHEP